MNDVIPEAVAVARRCEELNELERFMEAHPNRKEASEFPTFHRFTPGLVSRTVILEAGESCVSRVHLTEHQFVISDGVAKIWSPRRGWEVVCSPHHGVTKIGDRRAVNALSRLTWTTFHATKTTDIAELEKELFA